MAQSRIKTPKARAGKMLTEQDEGPRAVSKQGQAVSGKERETKNSPKLRPSRQRKGVTET